MSDFVEMLKKWAYNSPVKKILNFKQFKGRGIYDKVKAEAFFGNQKL